MQLRLARRTNELASGIRTLLCLTLTSLTTRNKYPAQSVCKRDLDLSLRKLVAVNHKRDWQALESFRAVAALVSSFESAEKIARHDQEEILPYVALQKQQNQHAKTELQLQRPHHAVPHRERARRAGA